MKIAIFILGVALGVNLGYVLMIPSRNSVTNKLSKCSEVYKQSSQELIKEQSRCYSDQMKLVETLQQCVKDLDRCNDDLGLLQGRSK